VTKFEYQRGSSLVEALIAFAIVGTGLLSVAAFQSGLFKQSAHNKAQTEAVSLAQQKIEQLKHYTLANEDAYIDDNNDGVMDANGSYTGDPIAGRNAVFQRSWELATNDLGRQVDVTVSWTDADNQTQSVSLSAEIPWISPRTAADQLVDLDDPILDSPTGRAVLGDGNLSEIPQEDLTSFPNSDPNDGLNLFQYNENLLLANSDGEILLTLVDACSTNTGQCNDFVRISGTVYKDTANSGVAIEDLSVLASDAAFCQRWVPEGSSLAEPPTTASGDYEYFNYTCYLGGGWHGNIGFVKRRGLQLKDKICQGDPTSINEWEKSVISLRRAYRGMIYKDIAGSVEYYSHGIKDAARITGQDYVFTELDADMTEGFHCSAVDAPMTRPDSNGGELFRGVPTDFVCLNHDDDGDGAPDLLDTFDTRTFGVDTTCPFDPTDPPVRSHQVSGLINITSGVPLDLSNFQVVTTDGPGNCTIKQTLTAEGYYTLGYSCTVYDWGTGWTGAVVLQPNSEWLYCPAQAAPFSALTADAAQDFSCTGGPTIEIGGSISYLVDALPIESIILEEGATGFRGYCEVIATKYRCVAPYDGTFWSGTMTAPTDMYVCGSTNNVISLDGLTSAGSPYRYDLIVARGEVKCPLTILYESGDTP
jgi:Tfp pilus assembly protein PilV